MKMIGMSILPAASSTWKSSPPEARQSHVQDQAAHFIRRLALQKFRGRAEGRAPQADGAEKILQPLSHLRLVVHHENNCIVFGAILHGSPLAAVSPAVGNGRTAHSEPRTLQQAGHGINALLLAMFQVLSPVAARSAGHAPGELAPG
jgi:hypothetical protein